jgi:sugar phosphate permease
MLNAQLIFIISALGSVGAAAAYCAGIVSQEAMTKAGVPAIVIALLAFVTIATSPPPPPLSPAEQAKQKAADDGFLLGLTSGMLLGR